MERKVYLHYEGGNGTALTVSQKVTSLTTLHVVLESFLIQLESSLKIYTSLHQLNLKTDEGEVIITKGNNLSCLLETLIDDDVRDLIVTMEADPNSISPTESISLVSAPTSYSSKHPSIEKSMNIRREEIARSIESIRTLEDLIRCRSYKKARNLIETSIIPQNSYNETSTFCGTAFGAFALRCLMEIALCSGRFDEVLALHEKLNKFNANHPYLMECNVMSALACKGKGGNNLLKLAVKNFDVASRTWKNELVRSRQQPEYVRTEEYFLCITALHAQSVFEMGLHNEAANILNSVMDNPLADTHLAILTTYGNFTIRFNKFQDTINAVLKAIAIVGTQSRQSPNQPLYKSSTVEKTVVPYFPNFENDVKMLVTELLSNKEGFDNLIKMFPPNSRGTAEVYAYLASTVKEFSAIDLCVRLYDLALQVQSNHANYTLNLIHAYEVKLQYDNALEQFRIFCAKNLKLSIGKESAAPYTLSCAQVIEAMKREVAMEDTAKYCEASAQSCSSRVQTHRVLWMERGDRQYAVVEMVDKDNQVEENAFAPFERIGGVSSSDFSVSFTEKEMDLLALFATIVKVLFLSGHLSKLPTLIQFIEAIRRLSKISLHQTSIRNEIAYYSHIVQILFHRNHVGHYGLPIHVNAFVDPLLSEEQHFVTARRNPIYICGDSHCLSAAWSTVIVNSELRLLFPKLVTGVKQYHLRDGGQFYTKENFFHAVGSVPSNSDVSFPNDSGIISCNHWNRLFF